MRKLALLLILCTLALVPGTGCDENPRPRELPAPKFDTSRLFENVQSADRASRAEEGFEERINQLMAGEAGPEVAPTRAVQRVPLGASLVGDIPDDFEAWRWSRQGDRTLISYTPPGEAPQLVILTRDYSMAGALSPAQQMRAFLVDVDPALTDGFDVGALMQQAASGGLPVSQLAGPGGDIPVDALLDAMAGAATMTGGRGLGYQSGPKTFSGWRYIGKNSEDVTLRFATSRGIWGAQPALPPGLDANSLQSIVGAAAGDQGPGVDIDGGLESLRGLGGTLSGSQDQAPAANQGRLVDQQRPSGLSRLPPRSAQMFVGQAELSPQRGIYVAILCATEAHCPKAFELATFLEGMHSADTPPSGRQTPFEDHATSLGLYFQ